MRSEIRSHNLSGSREMAAAARGELRFVRGEADRIRADGERRLAKAIR
jgi:hypothetical protein